jgi:hypothetical protein
MTGLTMYATTSALPYAFMGCCLDIERILPFVISVITRRRRRRRHSKNNMLQHMKQDFKE